VQHEREGKLPGCPEAAAAIQEYIELFYNRRRLHSTLGDQSPAAYEGLYETQVTQAA